MYLLKKFVLAGVLCCLSVFVHAQTNHIYWIGFKDKNATPYTLQQAQDFLSQRAIDRRTRQQITVDSLDLPIPNDYVQTIDGYSGTTIKLQSKWLNGLLVILSDSLVLDNIRALPFVGDVAWIKTATNVWPYVIHNHNILLDSLALATPTPNFDMQYYGTSWNQISICNGHSLHARGYEGTGKLIAVIDAGFDEWDTNPYMQTVVQSGRVIDTYNFLRQNNNLQQTGSHGLQVWSMMAGAVPNTFVGTAPEASYALYHTDDLTHESYVEIYAFIAALERADSIGADVINSSLGYNYFDEPEHNYTIAQLDGLSTIITQSVQRAVSKGIVVVNSAGNEGNRPWKELLFPADARNAITVGNVGIDSVRNVSSSMGNVQNGKPDIVTLGTNIRVVRSDASIVPGTGTSFAAPVISGLVACLLEAQPMLQAQAIQSLLHNYAHKGLNDSMRYYGYGVPDFEALLNQVLSSPKLAIDFGLKVYPNPVVDELNIAVQLIEGGTWSVVDALGKMVASGEIKTSQWRINTAHWDAGIYVLRVQNAKGYEVYKLIKLVR